MDKRILVRADDIGYCRGVNYGIADSVWNGIIRSAGVMPNMPEVQHGLDLIKGSGICLGLHTNVCLGKPCADPEKIPSLLDADGNLLSSKVYREAAKAGREIVTLDEMIIEVEAQLERYMELTGDKPHYFEAHAVFSQNLYKALQIVAEKHDLPILNQDFMKPSFRFRSSELFMSMDSMKPGYDPFESLKKAALTDYGKDGLAMFVCHPGYMDDFLIHNSSLTVPRTQEVAMLTSEETKKWLAENHVKVVSYDEL